MAEWVIGAAIGAGAVHHHNKRKRRRQAAAARAAAMARPPTVYMNPTAIPNNVQQEVVRTEQTLVYPTTQQQYAPQVGVPIAMPIQSQQQHQYEQIYPPVNTTSTVSNAAPPQVVDPFEASSYSYQSTNNTSYQ